ncbi:MAG: hypothetical protein U9Q74_14445, partial [Gemmatimonadota bacterium]|nr:hypothetical protein [Gemmatimonadota bacterium]
MSELTQNYQLVTSVAVDDFVQPGHNNRLADTVDRVVGSVLKRLATEGVYDGWEIQSDKTVSAGEGLIAACWCETTQAQAITGLTDDAVNHVFVQPTADGAPGG